MRLHDYPASANCLKVRLLLAQLGLPYDRVPVDIFAGDTLSCEYGRMNPFRSTPVLELEPGQFLLESGAILVYLAEGSPFMPVAALERAEVVRWLIQEQAEVMPAIGGLRFRLQTGRLAPSDPAARGRRAGGERILDLLDAHLAGRAYLVGCAYSIADIALHAYVHVAGEAGYDLGARPAVSAWLERVAATPGYVNDLEPYPANARPGAGRSVYD